MKRGGLSNYLTSLKELLLRTALVLFSLGFLLIGLEICFRFAERLEVRSVSKEKYRGQNQQKVRYVQAKNEPITGLYKTTRTGRRLFPNTHVIIDRHYLSSQWIEIMTNSLGFRHPELGPKGTDEFRILVLGDSVTFGDFVNDKETYVRQMEYKLNKEKISGTKMSAINAAVGAIDLKTEYHILTETGLLITPDLVLIGLYLNDASSSLGVKLLPFPLDRSRFLEWSHWKITALKRMIFQKKRKMALQKWISEFTGSRILKKGDWTFDRNAFDKEIMDAIDDWGYAWTDQAWEHMAQILSQFKTLEARHNFRTVLALFPVRFQVESNFLNDTPQQYFDKVATHLKLPHLDLLPSLRNAWQSSKEPLFYDHCHLTPHGNQIVAEALVRFFKDQNLISR